MIIHHHDVGKGDLRKIHVNCFTFPRRMIRSRLPREAL